MKWIPINEKAIVQFETTEKTESGIYLSSEQKENHKGVILDICENEIGLEPGDVVLCSKFVGDDIEIKHGDEEFKNIKFIPIDSILAYAKKEGQ